MKIAENLPVNRYRFAIDQIKRLSGEHKNRVLFDIGPGDARLRDLVPSNWIWMGFDRKAWGDVAAWNLVEPCPVAGLQADAVLLLDVIEHLPNPGLALRNIANSMREGGSLILTTPNPRWSGSRINMLARGVLGGFSERDLEENYHVLPMWPHVLERFAGEAGLITELYVTLDGHTTLLDSRGRRRSLVRYLANSVQIIIEMSDISARGMSYGIVATKRSGGLVQYEYPSGAVA